MSNNCPKALRRQLVDIYWTSYAYLVSVSTILTDMVSVSSSFFLTLDLPLHLQCDSNSSIPTIRSAANREHQNMETARHHICIYNVTLLGLGQELNLHLPLQCTIHAEMFTK